MPDTPRLLPTKKEVALGLLEGPSMFVHLDPRREGAVVPKWLANQPQLVLQLGLNMAIPIPDLKVDDEGITCTLSFNRSPFWCRIPWSAVYALVGEDGPQRSMVWPNDVPPEVVAQMQRTKSPSQKPPRRPRARIAADADGGVAGAAPAQGADSSAEAAREGTPRERAPRPVALPAIARDRDDRGDRAGPRPLQQVPARSPSTPAGTTAAGKKRRELPPYLRVIK